ncbi:MAG: hypothetical protein ACPGVB_08055 [Chitinophagales bacterium]
MAIKDIIWWFLKLLLILTLPFILLIRGAIYLHIHYQTYPSLSIIGGMILAILVVIVYLVFVYGYLTGYWASLQTLKKIAVIALFLVGAYALHALLFLAKHNAKTPAIQEQYTELHPILRLSISTVLFLDGDVMITDAQRQPEDYRKMGLPSKKRSLHFPQKDGYVHAIDIRTNGHSEFRNFLLKTYFYSMGFNTLRHVGTGDHLHISLLSHDYPHGI